ncbi:response regulator [Paenibacillus chartarius]|uniref:Response regulator n=1 Tax=Paenibacillus chartarius TaxID=747481 RepID=A0ABV6DPT1_9BACL
MTQRILIIDDSPVMRRNLRSILTAAGYEIAAEASNGDEGCRAYKLHRPDLVTMDVTMPVMNGIDAVREIVAYDPRAVILVISAFDQRSMLFEALEKGAKKYIVKPITAEKLLRAVEELLLAPASANSGDVSAAPHTPELHSAQAGQSNALAQQPPVSIENREGTFFIALTAETSEAALGAIRPALQGLLFIRPLRICVDFGDMAEMSEPLLRLLDDLLKPVRAAGGSTVYVAGHEALRRRLQSLYPAIPVETHE